VLREDPAAFPAARRSFVTIAASATDLPFPYTRSELPIEAMPSVVFNRLFEWRRHVLLGGTTQSTGVAPVSPAFFDQKEGRRLIVREILLHRTTHVKHN
jgi:hypothetical protein